MITVEDREFEGLEDKECPECGCECAQFYDTGDCEACDCCGQQE